VYLLSTIIPGSINMDVTPLKSDSILSMGKEKGKGCTTQDIKTGLRIAQLRKALGISGEAFSKGITGLHKSNLSYIERGKGNRKATAAMLRDIANKYPNHTSLDDLMGFTSTKAGMYAKSKTRLLPILNEVQAGDYLAASDLDLPPGFSEDYSPSVSDDPNAFILIVRGESMIGGDIRPGDYVLVEPNRQVDNGSIVVAIGPKGASIKKFRKSEDMIILSPMNPDFPPLLVGKKEIEEYRFYRVTSLQRKL
jgi:SOS-response transcriptional repressor LexA